MEYVCVQGKCLNKGVGEGGVFTLSVVELCRVNCIYLFMSALSTYLWLQVIISHSVTQIRIKL